VSTDENIEHPITGYIPNKRCGIDVFPYVDPFRAAFRPVNNVQMAVERRDDDV
jgi:hypothetical protein